MPTPLRTPNDLVTLLKARRRELGESQSRFAARIGRTQGWVSNFEKGEFENIPLTTLLQILPLAGVTLVLDTPDALKPSAPIRQEDGDLALDFEDDAEGFSP